MTLEELHDTLTPDDRFFEIYHFGGGWNGRLRFKVSRDRRGPASFVGRLPLPFRQTGGDERNFFLHERVVGHFCGPKVLLAAGWEKLLISVLVAGELLLSRRRGGGGAAEDFSLGVGSCCGHCISLEKVARYSLASFFPLLTIHLNNSNADLYLLQSLVGVSREVRYCTDRKGNL
jgi:hypothetical protein